MRLWSLHPEYLDAKGLVALWREALLAQNVLLGKTKGYKNHPQLKRFKKTANPVGAIASYLRAVETQASKRNYNFNRDKISNRRLLKPIAVTTGQIEYESQHLKQKLKIRDPEKFKILNTTTNVKLHPLFIEINGAIEDWEII